MTPLERPREVADAIDGADRIRARRRRDARSGGLMPSLSAIDRRPTQLCYPLQEDAELAEAVDAPGGRRPPRRWSPASSNSRRARGREPLPAVMGSALLVLQGLLVLRVGVAGRHSAELLGEGDVLRRPDSDWATQLTPTHSWLVLEPTRLAVLDSQFVNRLTGFPQLAGALFGRASLRSRQLAVNMAIVHQARVDVRLHMLLWHLAGRSGLGAFRRDRGVAAADPQHPRRARRGATADRHQRPLGAQPQRPRTLGAEGWLLLRSAPRRPRRARSQRRARRGRRRRSR